MSKEQFTSELESVKERLGLNVISDGERTNLIKVLGGSLTQPFTTSNSGYRKLMHSIHKEHALNLINPEIPYTSTGHEYKQGQLSSYLIKSDSDLEVVSKISKFEFNPNHHYYLLVKDEKNKELGIIERISYRHCSESTGFFYDNKYLDSLIPTDDEEALEQVRLNAYTEEWDRLSGNYTSVYGFDDSSIDAQADEYGDSVRDSKCIIPKGTTVKKPSSFDDADIHRQGVNALVAYLDENQYIEDPVGMRLGFAQKLNTPTVKPVPICINENDILINIHGNADVYKPLPDIGEVITENRLYCLRRQVKEDCLYTQSKERLRQPMPSDEFSPVKGMVVDIDVFCNNVHSLDSEYNQQIKYYYDNQMRFANEMVSKINAFRYENPEYSLSHDTQVIYEMCDKMSKGVQFIKDDKPFNNLRIDITVVEHNTLKEGDKICNRCGGKGVVAVLIPDEKMPRLNGRPVDMIWRSNTGINRENVTQYKETCLNNFKTQILDHIKNECHSNDERMDELCKLYDLTNPTYAEYFRNKMEDFMTESEVAEFWESLFEQDCIPGVLDPIDDNLGIDEFWEIYQQFPYITMPTLQVPVEDCRGNIRFIDSRRPVGIGYQYIYRLKQYAEEKYSETSLSTVNIKGDNAKSKASKEYKELHKRTAIRMGHMENDSLSHIGADAVVTFLMLYSVSPTGRLAAQSILTDNPFEINLKLTEKDRNRKVETYMTRFEAMGLELKIDIKKKKKKVIFPLQNRPIFPLQPRKKVDKKEPIFPLVMKK